MHITMPHFSTIIWNIFQFVQSTGVSLKDAQLRCFSQRQLYALLMAPSRNLRHDKPSVVLITSDTDR